MLLDWKTVLHHLIDLSVDVNTPIERYALPESTDDQAILIKAIGNQTTISIQWLIHPEDTNVVRQTFNACDAESCNAKGGIFGGDTTSTENQLKWWSTVFQSNSITDRYHLYLGDCTVNNLCMGTGAYPPVCKVDEIANQA